MNNLGQKSILAEEKIGPFLKSDFEFISKYLVKKIKGMINKIGTMKLSSDFFEVSKNAFYLRHFMDDMIFFGYPKITEKLEEIFYSNFGSKYILKSIQEENFNKAIVGKSGQFQIGENEYVIHRKKIYYKSFSGKWYVISPTQAFYLLPELKENANESIVSNLDKIYTPTLLDNVYHLWLNKNYSKNIPDKAIIIKHGATTPERYFSETVHQIKKIIKNPIALGTIENAHNQGEHYIESICKVSYKIIDFVKKLRSANNCPFYLLRDGIMFAETQKTIDILRGDKTLSSQVMISRKILSTVETEAYYWNLAVDALYSALKEYPYDFEKFYETYVSRMKEKEESCPDFKNILLKLAEYIKPHITEAIERNKNIIVVDTGLQGSINMLTKYIIDQHIFSKNTGAKCNVYMFVVGEWFKGIYSNKYHSNYYPMMKDIEVFNRSDFLYAYKAGSFNSGKLEVEMGSDEKQFLANIELMTLVTTCKLLNEINML